MPPKSNLYIPNPDPPEAENKLPQRHQDTKRNRCLIFIFASWCLGGEIDQNIKELIKCQRELETNLLQRPAL
jgi:hypothetical protein